MMLRLGRRGIPLVVALLLVSSQFAATLHAGDMASMQKARSSGMDMDGSPGMNMKESSGMPEMAGGKKRMSSMHAPLKRTGDMSNQTLCKLCCDQDAQSSRAGFPNLSPLVIAFVLLGMLSLLLAAPRLLRSNFNWNALVARSPPLRIQYMTFRN